MEAVMSEELFTFSKNIPIKKPHDVIVTGGGVAGVAAAVSAARHGASVLLIEKSNILGGLATLGLVNLFVPMQRARQADNIRTCRKVAARIDKIRL